MPTKGNTPAAQTETHLGKVPWLENGAGPHQDRANPHPDQRVVEHDGYTVLCRRVDGGALTDMQPYNQNNPGGQADQSPYNLYKGGPKAFKENATNLNRLARRKSSSLEPLQTKQLAWWRDKGIAISLCVGRKCVEPQKIT